MTQENVYPKMSDSEMLGWTLEKLEALCAEARNIGMEPQLMGNALLIEAAIMARVGGLRESAFASEAWHIFSEIDMLLDEEGELQ